MNGYCQNCFMIVEMVNVETVKLPNQSFIHRGYCTTPKCDGIIFVKIYDHEVIIVDNGLKYPKEVFVGEKTPKRLVIDEAGQTIFKKDEVIQTTPKEGKVVTVFDIKNEKEKADENIK